MRTAAKVDANHGEIVKAFRRLGCTVLSLAALGKGVPDILVAMKGNHNVLVEIKSGDKAELTPDQEEWHANWGTPVHIVRHLGDVINLVNAYR